MAASFQLPTTAPPGNVYPSPQKPVSTSRGLSPVPEAKTPTSAVELITLKPDTRQVLVEVTEANNVGAASPESANLPPPPPSGGPSSQRPTTPQRHGPPQLTVNTGAKRESPARSHTSSPTLVHNSSDASEEVVEQTPVMRSMFPRYDASVPLPQQSYARPQERMPPPPSGPPPGHYSPSLYSQTQSPPMAPSHGPWTASRVSNVNGASPLRITEQPPPDLSSGEDLLDLWSVANGQSSEEAKETYTLGLFCESLAHDHEAIHLTSDTSAIYSLHSSGDTVVLTRTHPLNPSTEITICMPVIQQPTVTSPLLATIFPALAELMALDTASNIAITHRLSRNDSQALQTEALNRARTSETAQLLWDSDSQVYYLAHPSLLNANSSSPATLPIHINPQRSITLFSSDSSPIMALDLTNLSLTIHVPAILLLSPSLYTLDTLLSTLLTLLLHLHRKTSLLSTHSYSHPTQPLPVFDPPPTSSALAIPARARSKPANTQNKLTRWFSHRNASSPTLAGARSPALSSTTTPRVTPSPFPDHDKDLEMGLASPVPALSSPIPSIPKAGVAPELRKETTGVDLSRFQAFDLSDPDLGRGTKVVLRVLYWGFGVLVWILGVGVGVLAAGVVAVGGLGGGGGRERLRDDKKGKSGPVLAGRHG